MLASVLNYEAEQTSIAWGPSRITQYFNPSLARGNQLPVANFLFETITCIS